LSLLLCRADSNDYEQKYRHGRVLKPFGVLQRLRFRNIYVHADFAVLEQSWQMERQWPCARRSVLSSSLSLPSASVNGAFLLPSRSRSAAIQNTWAMAGKLPGETWPPLAIRPHARCPYIELV